MSVSRPKSHAQLDFSHLRGTPDLVQYGGDSKELSKEMSLQDDRSPSKVVGVNSSNHHPYEQVHQFLSKTHLKDVPDYKRLPEEAYCSKCGFKNSKLLEATIPN